MERTGAALRAWGHGVSLSANSTRGGSAGTVSTGTVFGPWALCGGAGGGGDAKGMSVGRPKVRRNVGGLEATVFQAWTARGGCIGEGGGIPSPAGSDWGTVAGSRGGGCSVRCAVVRILCRPDWLDEWRPGQDRGCAGQELETVKPKAAGSNSPRRHWRAPDGTA